MKIKKCINLNIKKIHGHGSVINFWIQTKKNNFMNSVFTVKRVKLN
jgi:hypothetical protein